MEATVWLALAAFTGGILSTLALWFKSKGQFGWMDFGAAAIGSVVGAVILAQRVQLTAPLSVNDLFNIFLQGMGVTAVVTAVPSASVKGARIFARVIREKWQD